MRQYQEKNPVVPHRTGSFSRLPCTGGCRICGGQENGGS